MCFKSFSFLDDDFSSLPLLFLFCFFRVVVVVSSSLSGRKIVRHSRRENEGKLGWTCACDENAC